MGEVERREDLAASIKAEHRAAQAAIAATLQHAGAAMDHAMSAGDLLIRAKALYGKHGQWEDWVRKNVDGLSLRRAQEYMYMAEHRDELEEAKARGSAFSSVQGALGYLRRAQHVPGWANQPPGVPPVPGTAPLTPAQENVRSAKEREQRRILERAEYAIRSGNFDPPPEIEGGKWQHVLYQATQLREQNVPHVIDALGHNLHILLRHADPEAVGRHLGELTNDYDEAEHREGLIEELREGLAWLTRVIEEAEAARGREG